MAHSILFRRHLSSTTRSSVGYCTPGQIMSAVACIDEGHATSDDDIREFMSGNICRCSAYPQIVAAVREAAATSGAHATV